MPDRNSKANAAKRVSVIGRHDHLAVALRRSNIAPTVRFLPFDSTESVAASIKKACPDILFIEPLVCSPNETEFTGLKSLLDIRFDRDIKVQPYVLLYAFDAHRALKNASLRDFGQDITSTTGCTFIRLPLILHDLELVVLTAKKCLPLDRQTLLNDLRPASARLAKVLWNDFDHECRNLKRTAEGWKRLKRQLLPQFIQALDRISVTNDELRPELRKALEKVASQDSPHFELLYRVLANDEEEAVDTLSLSSGSLGTPVETSSPEKSSERGDPTIMIIDDDVDLVQEISEDLIGFGYKVALITDRYMKTEQILRRITANKAKIVLLDLKFGSVEKGFDILSGIKEQRSDTKVIIVTGYGNDTEVLIRAKHLGADEFVRKPITVSSLVQSIELLLTNRTVLIIDDHMDEVLTPDVESRFITQRCRVVSFSDPVQALNDLESRIIDVADVGLVLLDLKFGDSFEPGFTAFRRLKRIRQDIPIFILTGYASYQVIYDVAFKSLKDCFSPPSDDFMVKPLEEKHWPRIWGALFPEPDHLVLVPAKKRVVLMNIGDSPLAELRFAEKAFVLLHALALKRERGLETGIVPPGWEEQSQDQELRELRFYAWTGKEISEYRTEINSKLSKALKRDWELVGRDTDGSYILSEQIKRVRFSS
jgi:CheY-like chemotaxis protein